MTPQKQKESFVDILSDFLSAREAYRNSCDAPSDERAYYSSDYVDNLWSEMDKAARKLEKYINVKTN
jgi:hypothetical protein